MGEEVLAQRLSAREACSLISEILKGFLPSISLADEAFEHAIAEFLTGSGDCASQATGLNPCHRSK
jgi:hypothetical protein